LAEESVTLLTWNHECVVGVKAMDDQHGIIMDTMNELRQMIVQGRERRVICDQLDRLIEFTQRHFESEEQLLAQRGFPGLQDHRAAHARLMSQIQAAVEHAKHSEDVEIQPLFHFLRAWYMEHIEGLDRQYGPWLNQRGVY
jgi:hemerythrin-like metal-binding protein